MNLRCSSIRPQQQQSPLCSSLHSAGYHEESFHGWQEMTANHCVEVKSQQHTNLFWLRHILVTHQWLFHLFIKTSRLGRAQWQSSSTRQRQEIGVGKKAAAKKALKHSWTLKLMDAASQRCSDPCSSSSSSSSDVKLLNVFRILFFDGFHKLIPGQRQTAVLTQAQAS